MNGHRIAEEGNVFDLPSLSRYFSELSPQALVAVEGPKHVVRYVNAAFARLAGRNEEEMLGLPFAEAVPEEGGNECLSLLDRVFRTGSPEALAEQPHGPAHTASWSYLAWGVLDGTKRPAGVMIQISDVTEAALFRERARAMNESLLISSTRQHELTETAEKLSGRLRIAIEDREYFMAVVSHELRTPLTPVLVAVSKLEEDERLDGDIRKTLEMIARNITLEARLINDLLDVTRIERGKVELSREPVDLRLLIDRVVEICRFDIDNGELTYEADWDGGPYIVDADAVRLEQVFWNLLRNAIKFTPAGGRIHLSGRRDCDSAVRVEITDNGVGIDPETLLLLFQAFQQGHRNQIRKFGGLGLGLAISKSMVEMHGGTIRAASGGAGKGATFSVRLPTISDARVAPARTDSSGTRALLPVRPLRILVVEDHVDTAQGLSSILTADGHVVEVASRVEAALNRARESTFDLLISDLGLPDGSGIDLMKALRQERSTLRGIALSGYSQDRDILQSREAGFAVHLVKPVTVTILREAIAAVTSSLDPETPGARRVPEP